MTTPTNPTQDERSTFIRTFAQELLSSTHPVRVIDHYEKQFEAHTQEREEQARKEGYEQGYNAAKT